MGKDKSTDQRVFSVAPEGTASIETSQTQNSPFPTSSSPDEVIFLTHILSLKTAALIHLGVIKEAGEQVDLETAQQMIETLIVIEKRTRGNLSFEEHRLLEAALDELRLAYLKVRS